MLAYAYVLVASYHAQNYASIIRQCLVIAYIVHDIVLITKAVV